MQICLVSITLQQLSNSQFINTEMGLHGGRISVIVCVYAQNTPIVLDISTKDVNLKRDMISSGLTNSTVNYCLESFQSRFRISYGTKTASGALVGDMRGDLNWGSATLLVRRDLSAAFNTWYPSVAPAGLGSW